MSDYMTVPMIGGDTARMRMTDPSNGTRGRKRFKPLTRYVVDEDGCWLWQGFVGSNGYGQCYSGLAHRHFYRELVGDIPDGMHIDHTCHRPVECNAGSACKHRRCVNPDHLAVVTPRENVLRSNSFIAHNATATHCPYGHPYSGDNLVILPTQRTCLTCSRRRWRNAHERERARVAARDSLTNPERRVLDAFTGMPRTDVEVAEILGITRQTVSQRRAALVRGGAIVQVGTRAVVPGTRPALVWRAA